MSEVKLSTTKQVTVEDLKNIMGGQEEVISIKGTVSYKNGGFEATGEVEN